MPRLFAGVRKYLQINGILGGTLRACSPLFVWVGVLLVYLVYQGYLRRAQAKSRKGCGGESSEGGNYGKRRRSMTRRFVILIARGVRHSGVRRGTRGATEAGAGPDRGAPGFAGCAGGAAEGRGKAEVARDLG